MGQRVIWSTAIPTPSQQPKTCRHPIVQELRASAAASRPVAEPAREKAPNLKGGPKVTIADLSDANCLRLLANGSINFGVLLRKALPVAGGE